MTKAFTGKNSFEKALWHRYKHNEDIMIIIDGKQENGMSSSSLNLANQMNKSFNKKKME